MRPEPGKTTTYTSLENVKVTAPSIKFSRQAIKWIKAMVDLHQLEVGLYGIVEETGPNAYLVKEIFYPKHSEANAATCEISPEGETDMARWLMDKNREADLTKIRFWGHSHHNMGVSPSGQDETQAIERMERRMSYLIRGIFNKEELMSVSFFDYQNKRRFDHIKWEIEDDDTEDAEIRKKILELKEINIPKAIAASGYSQYNGYHNQWDMEGNFIDYPVVDKYSRKPWMNNLKPSAIVNFGDVKKKKHKNSYEFEFSQKYPEETK